MNFINLFSDFENSIPFKSYQGFSGFGYSHPYTFVKQKNVTLDSAKRMKQKTSSKPTLLFQQRILSFFVWEKYHFTADLISSLTGLDLVALLVINLTTDLNVWLNLNQSNRRSSVGTVKLPVMKVFAVRKHST